MTTTSEENKSQAMKILQHPTILYFANYQVLMKTWHTAELIAKKGLPRVQLSYWDSALPRGYQ